MKRCGAGEKEGAWGTTKETEARLRRPEANAVLSRVAFFQSKGEQRAFALFLLIRPMEHENMRQAMDGVLLLEDGSIFRGEGVSPGIATGEVVFNTSMTGYQEVITDPSYAEQIVVMTYPYMGNYGIRQRDSQSKRPWLHGFVAREFWRETKNLLSQGNVLDFLRMEGVPAIEGIDTRAVVKRTREKGAMKGLIAAGGPFHEPSLKRMLDEYPGLAGQDLTERVTCQAPYIFSDPDAPASGMVAVYDFGVKSGILKSLASFGFRIEVFPANTPPDAILSLHPSGVILSNGPGDPSAVKGGIEACRHLLGKVPIFGICLGHQILGLALGGRTFKLKFGHRGGNQPVLNVRENRVEITAQNHGFAVDPESLSDTIEVTHINLNDGTLEGMRVKGLPAFSVQYHPEASPGPSDASYLFHEFALMIMKHRGKVPEIPSRTFSSRRI